MLTENKRDKSIKQKITDKLSNWEKIGDTPSFHFYWYYPEDEWGDNIPSEALQVRTFIDGIDFRSGRKKSDNDEVLYLFDRQLHEIFGEYINSVIVITRENYKRDLFGSRLHSLCHALADFVGVNNGYEHDYWNREKTGIDQQCYEADEVWFKGKFVVVVETNLTPEVETSMKDFLSKLKKIGVHVSCVLSIGRNVPKNSMGYPDYSKINIEYADANYTMRYFSLNDTIRRGKMPLRYNYWPIKRPKYGFSENLFDQSEKFYFGDEKKINIKDVKFVNEYDGNYVEVIQKNNCKLFFPLYDGTDFDLSESIDLDEMRILVLENGEEKICRVIKL